MLNMLRFRPSEVRDGYGLGKQITDHCRIDKPFLNEALECDDCSVGFTSALVN